MAAKKNKAKIPSKNEGYKRNLYWLEIPKQIVQSLPQNRKINPLHCVNMTTGTTKTWVPTTSRCGRSRPPRLRHVDESAYLKYFPTARVNDRIFFRSFSQFSCAEYGRMLADPFNVRRDPLFQNNEKNHMHFTSSVYFEGKSYELSLQGTLVVVETIDSIPTITGAASNRAVPSLSCRFFKEYLVEIDGEIVLILFVHQKSLGIVDFIQVFRLCLRKVKWIEVEGIGGNVVVLDPLFVWGNSEEIGCKGNCIYFTQASSSGWLVYDMDNGGLISYV